MCFIKMKLIYYEKTNKDEIGELYLTHELYLTKLFCSREIKK